jgi:hypothetical protein
MFFKTRTFVVILVKIEIKIDPTLGVVHCCVCPVLLAAIFALLGTWLTKYETIEPHNRSVHNLQGMHPVMLAYINLFI